MINKNDNRAHYNTIEHLTTRIRHNRHMLDSLRRAVKDVHQDYKHDYHVLIREYADRMNSDILTLQKIKQAYAGKESNG